MSETLAQHLRALRAKEITFAAFHRRTRVEWHRMAVVLHRRYNLPPTVTADDVEQELLFGAHLAVESWQEGRAPLASYVVWSSHNRAQKWLHRQRGCNLHTRKGASLYALAASSIARPDGSSVFDQATPGAPDSERQMDVERVLAMIPKISETEAGKRALALYVETGADEAQAAERLWSDGMLFRIRSAEHARQIVKSEVRRLRQAVLSEN